ncbi:MAG: transglutaminase family protein, partial [Anaerolineales bacterium]|nr:transglutaminase family protein [Anaerolineales bacterium]
TATTTARPAMIIPDTIDPAYVTGTVDADMTDEDMLWAAAAFTQDPVAAFNMVKTFAYDPYKGSLRGTRGTLWGESGNALDQASLLIALLRAAGIPARYRHGSLDTAEAQTLLDSMFPITQGAAGYLPTAVTLADPLNNAGLIALAQDHWWVEAYLPGQGWTNLDPTFPAASLGDVAATPATDGSDRIAEIPDALRHKVHMELEIEQYNSFPIGGTNLSTSVPLTAAFAASQVASKAVILGHLLTSNIPPGLVFSTVEHTYTPYFGINGDQYVEFGESFSDLMTSFPLASHFTTAAWITFELTDADGNSETFTREVKDSIGVATRLLGGVIDISSPTDNAPFISFEDAFVADFLPNMIGNASYAQRHEAELQYDLVALAQATEALPKDDLTTPEAQEQAGEIRYQGEIARSLLFSLTGLDFAFRSDALTATLAENLRVNLFYDRSRVIIMHGTSMQDSAIRTVDLRNTTAQAIVAPGQAESAARTAQWVKAVAESYFEVDALRDASGQEPITTARIFEAAAVQNIDLVYVTPGDLDLLDLYLPDPDAYGYAAAALLNGQEVLIPTKPVLID